VVRRPGLLVVTAVLAVALTGCDGGEPEPEFTDEVASSPSTPVSPTEPSPSEAFDPTQETAKEFIRRWIRLSNQVQRTGETDEYRRITRGCKECDSFATHMERIHRDGGFVRTKGERVRSMRHEGGPSWRVEVESFPTVYRESRDGQRGTFEGGDISYLVTIDKKKGEWRLTYYGEIQE
jgi:hypothetical protein